MNTTNIKKILLELKKDGIIDFYKLDYMIYDPEYLLKYGKNNNLKRYFIKYTTEFLGKNKYFTFNNDLKIDLKNEILKAIENNIDNVNLY